MAYPRVMDAFRAWADVDLDGLDQNLAAIRAAIGDGVVLMLVVKADAYGHGAVAVAHRAARAGVGAFGVGTASEALELRRAGIGPGCLRLAVGIEDLADLQRDLAVALERA